MLPWRLETGPVRTVTTTKFIITKILKETDMKNKRKLFYLCLFSAALLLPLTGCLIDDIGDGSDNGNSSVTVTVSPSSITLAKGTTQKFTATVTGSYSSSVTWSVEGNSSPTTTIDRDGLLTVAANESSRTLTVKATWSYYGDDTTSGTATVTVATDAEIPSNLKITKPEKTRLPLSWSVVTNASNYKVYRSINGEAYSHLADSSAASYTDTAITAGSSYYYAVSAVVSGLETGKSSVVFGIAEEYFALPVITDRRLVPIKASERQYYRFPVTSGESYTITWENGSSQNADYNVQCSAWENDGTRIMNRQTSGYTASKVFTAASTGYVTVEVGNWSNSYSYNYMAYCLRKNSEDDTGVVALPPAKVTNIKVTDPSVSSITLGWDTSLGAVSYNIYRSATKDATPGLLGTSTVSSYNDTTVNSGISYYYTVAPVNAGGKEGARVDMAFAYAALHYGLPTNSSSLQMMTIPASSRHYYRLSVAAGQNITITWENGSSQNADYNVQCSAWQNDGTQIMNRQTSGYTSPKGFNTTSGGFVTVEVGNWSSSNSYNYKIYYH
jgi:fibronectin type 3 domain-containing protein